MNKKKEKKRRKNDKILYLCEIPFEDHLSEVADYFMKNVFSAADERSNHPDTTFTWLYNWVGFTSQSFKQIKSNNKKNRCSREKKIEGRINWLKSMLFDRALFFCKTPEQAANLVTARNEQNSYIVRMSSTVAGSITITGVNSDNLVTHTRLALGDDGAVHSDNKTWRDWKHMMVEYKAILGCHNMLRVSNEKNGYDYCPAVIINI